MIPTAGEIWAELAALAPPCLAEEWDNCGLQVGNPDESVDRLLVSLDPTPRALDTAVRHGARMLLTHHPLIFHPIRSLDLRSYIPGLIARFIQEGVTLYAAHTNLDSSEPGVSTLLARMLHLEKTGPIIPSQQGEPTGLGRVGRLPAPTRVEEVASTLCRALGLKGIRLVGDPQAEVEVVAVCGGSGSSLLKQVVQAGAQLYITGEIKHSDSLEALGRGVVLMDAGHFATEAPIVPFLAQLLQERAAERGWNLHVIPDLQAGPPMRDWNFTGP